MSDGHRLRQSWYAALNGAEAHFRQLLTSSSSAEWKRLSPSADSSSSKKGKARAAAVPEVGDVVVHRNYSKAGGDVYRLVLDVPTGEDSVSLEPWKAVLTTPELRQEWDPAVEDAHLVEIFDHTTRISKTNFTLGWPANPRDAVTISRSFHDATTFIDISTSLPRSADEPVYLRPSPPYVRSHVTLFAWCIQHLAPPQLPSTPGGESPKKRSSSGGRLRITCFWQHDLRTPWNFGSSSTALQQLSTMGLGLLKTVMKRGSRIPNLTGYGNGVSIERVRFQIDREALTVDYAIIPEDEEHPATEQGIDELHAIREQRRLKRSIECVLPAGEGWDVRVSTKASSEEVERLPWSVRAIRSSSFPSTAEFSEGLPLDQIVVRLSHAPLIDEHSVLKVQVVVEISGSSGGLRLNGLPQTIQDVEERDPSSYFISKQILQDVSSTAGLSFNTASSMNTTSSLGSDSSEPTIPRPPTERSTAAEKSILSRVRRNYIYFSSLLQEPEAKWRRTTEAKGVSITQLDSIDPTLVVYRAEATFVGVGLWDLYSAVVSPGAKMLWDKQHEDAVLLEDVNDLTELWHFKTKPAWPANGRDSVVLKTVYKSPTTIHVFSFSADDAHLFPNIPPVDPTIIRTQVDLQGWAIETLSPTTTLLTLLEQSDPKGWTNKASIPTLMINALAGIGEFAIKCGGPPVVTRLSGAKANEMRYDHDRSSFKVEYEASTSRRSSSRGDSDASNDATSMPAIECELRCDLDTWASSLDIVVDPPPQSLSCLRRHRLSTEGGGLWLTLTHDAMFVDEERLLVLVRRAPGKEKGVVMVNGSKVAVDVEELQDSEIKSLTKRKRVKPARIPLDQPPVVSVIRRRRAEWDADSQDPSNFESNAQSMGWATAPRISSPLARFFTSAVYQASTTTQQAVAAITPATGVGGNAVPSSSKLPMQYALQALAWIQQSHWHGSSDGWTTLNDKALSVRRKLSPEISPVIQVHKGEKVIEGASADELAAIVTNFDCRKKWDERFDSATVLESYGADCQTAFIVAKASFPFRDRGFYVASVLARAHVPPSRRPTGDVAEQSHGLRNAIFCVSASFSPESASNFLPARYNPYGLPIGRVFVDAWILETLDPYTKENYAIPSTRCTRLVAVDYAGAIPAAFNSMINATMPRGILAVEAYFNSISSLPITRLPPAGLVISDKDEPIEDAAWRVRRRDENRVLVHTKYAPDTRIYRSRVLLQIPAPAPAASPTIRSDETPRPSRMTLSPGLPDTPESPVGLPSTGSENPLSSTTSGINGFPSSSSSLQAMAKERRMSASTSSPGRPRTESLGSEPVRHHLEPVPVRQRTESAGSAGARELRTRSSSAFTIKGEVRPPTDLLVAEFVVDSKLYPEGYAVGLKSWLRTDVEIGRRREFIPLCAGPGPGVSGETGSDVLPMVATVHVMPSSPLHSSGLRAEAPTRHLIKLTVPTAQYQISTVRDPLTDEMRSAPPKPPWLLALEGSGAVVEVEVRPASDKKSDVVVVDGKDVPVVNEKEALTTLGREELLDDRISKMSVLSRILNEPEVLSEQLRAPVAVADNLLDPSALAAVVVDGENSTEPRENTEADGSEETLSTPTSDVPTASPVVQSGGLLGFMTRFTNSTGSTSALPAISGETAASRSPKVPGGLVDIDAPLETRHTTVNVYTLSTLVTIAFISFLIGSLFRSLLSPADFIYVAAEFEGGEEAPGWREIRRMLQVKLPWGYDVHIALIHR